MFFGRTDLSVLLWPLLRLPSFESWLENVVVGWACGESKDCFGGQLV